jgi:hypothetical protein
MVPPMDPAKLRAWWAHRQGLDGSLRGASPAAVLERAGWARSVGGVGPYLSLFARAGIGRKAADAAVAKLTIHELPSARGCTYVVPASDFGLALAVGRDFHEADMRTAAKLGVTEKEIATLCRAVVKALEKEPLDPDGIREATGKASRSLGEAGKKKGLSTTLPLALGRLQGLGEIRRVPQNGRLDQQRYRYARWSPPNEPKEPFTELGRRYFTWVGPATISEFQWFSGLGAKVARQVLEPLKLVAAEPDGDRLLLPADVDAFRRFVVPKDPHYALVSSLDSIAAARRDVKTLVDDKDADKAVPAEKGSRAIALFSDLPGHAIFDRGRLVGLWEYDVDAGEIVWSTFLRKKDRALIAAVAETEKFVRDELEDARSFSLDSPKSRRPKIEALRAMA